MLIPSYWSKSKSLPLYLKPLKRLASSVPNIPDYWSILLIVPYSPPPTYTYWEIKAIDTFKSRVQSWNGVLSKCVIICFYWSILIIHNNGFHYWLLAHVHNYFNHIFTSIFTTLSCPTSTPTGSLSHLRQLLTYTLTSFAMCVIQWESEEEFIVPWVKGLCTRMWAPLPGGYWRQYLLPIHH